MRIAKRQLGHSRGLLVWVSGRGEGTGELAHGFTLEGKAEGIMDDAVEDGIGEGGILNLRVPLVDGELGGKETRGLAVAVIEEVEDIAGLIGGEGITEPFIEDDEVKGR